MQSYPYCGDRRLEPPDNSIEEAKREAAIDAACDELFDDGYLPDGSDTSKFMDAYVAEDQGELLDLLRAYRSGITQSVEAMKVCEILNRLAERMINDAT